MMASSPSSIPTFDPESFPPRLNLGCGFDHRDGYLNVDFQDFHHPELQADVRHLDALPDGFYLEVVAQDVLEHLPRTDVAGALAEWARVTKVGGVLILRVPDVLGVARLLSERRTLEEQELLIQNLFGTQAYSGDFHHFGFTEYLLRHYLWQAGFNTRSIVQRDEWLFDVEAVRVEHAAPPDPDQLQFMDLAPPPPPPPAWLEEATAALDQARATAEIDMLDGPTRLTAPKHALLRLLRIITHKQVAHNRAVVDLLERLVAEAGRDHQAR